jgi:two-component system LytT family response regulator
MMKKIKSIVIDDELANVNVISSMLAKHCPAIEVCACANSALDGYKLIVELNPELVFLDIKMPGKSGFELLKMFEDIAFHVIFISAFDQYAIQAFEFNAIDYILKPIDHTKLVRSVEKVERQIKNKDNSNVVHFIHSLDEKSQLVKSISLHQHEKVQIVELRHICFVHAARGYSEIVTEDNQKLLSAKSLSDYEELLAPFPHFLRVNKSMIINVHYVKEYTKGKDCLITVKNSVQEIEVSRRKKTEIIRYLKVGG